MVLFHLTFLLCTTIRPKIRVAIDLFLFCAHDHSTKIYGLLSFFFLFVHNHSTKVRSHSYSLIYSFLCRYVVCYIQGSISLIFCSLFFWQQCLYISYLVYSQQYCPYVSYAIFMEVLLLYFVRYIHGYMKSSPISRLLFTFAAHKLQKQLNSSNTFSYLFHNYHVTSLENFHSIKF